MGAYTATQVLAQSIKAVGDDPEKVADYLHKTAFNMPTGNVAWDAKGDLKAFDFPFTLGTRTAASPWLKSNPAIPSHPFFTRMAHSVSFIRPVGF